MFLKDKKITVVGLGKSGLSSALFLKRKGAIVRASDDGDPKRLEDSASLLDKHGIKYEIGQHTINYLKDSDLIVVSPGVKLSSKPLIWAKEMGIEVISEIELASRFCKSPIIAVTGTNGKSTVITLIGKILKEANKRAVVCGNIGRPFIKVLPSIGKNDFVVLEVSSFQLSFIKKFKPYIAILLNISRNHLDWHKSLSHYISSKANIFKNQTSQDYAILNFENKEFKKILEKE